MRAHQRAAQDALERQLIIGWFAARMNAQAGVGKLQPLDEWLAMVRPRPKRTVRDMILALQDAQARGAKITIRKVEG